MDDLDTRIRAALSEQDADLFGEPEPSLIQNVIAVFNTRMRWLNVIAMVYSLVFFGLAIWCAIRFFQADDVLMQLRWGAGLFFCIIAVTALKMWFWMELGRIQVVHELKRVELQIARLAARIDRSATE